ncbi:hypothetical protein TBLA_0D03790 [Henningerozyma blattae CBS 6284]|uniref:Uncharacterized protein n=1 Tax=Henningerozyma blattae (strain ATCC 34711 / CBS 6284 / DSM 70876 / NBRC 10599 / NRRL Y-10934 / UCD 77-7) TaxID=1071380 RepID=I2H3C6_HENB6|nr:hypothetical protein TBLA_0D03790 [Tetrapisispora blattae CBS 6284]CCH60878.1 hypothetical protein TBLA_0D03790 [Tetrapisispora blattae CBS 6284]
MFKSDWNYNVSSKTFKELDLSIFFTHKSKTISRYIFSIWAITVLKIALLCSDIYTCIKLLAFNTWANEVIQPYLSFKISKWLFSACILASVVLLVWEAVCGIRIFRTGNIALTYVNNFSRFLNSLFNYNRFCVYDRISPEGKSQKLAFFAFFELKDCIRLLFADSPRQVINGLTLWSVLLTVHSNSDLKDLQTFNNLISRIKRIAKTNYEEAVILSFMLFSFIIWLAFIIKFFIAVGCAIYVYIKFLPERNIGSLRQFVCITIAQNIDLLVIKQTRKRLLRKEKPSGEAQLNDNIDLENIDGDYFTTSSEFRNNSSISVIGDTAETDSLEETVKTPFMKTTCGNDIEKLASDNISGIEVDNASDISLGQLNPTEFSSPIMSTKRNSTNIYALKHVLDCKSADNLTLNSSQDNTNKALSKYHLQNKYPNNNGLELCMKDGSLLYDNTAYKNSYSSINIPRRKPPSLKIDNNIKTRKHILTPAGVYFSKSQVNVTKTSQPLKIEGENGVTERGIIESP